MSVKKCLILAAAGALYAVSTAGMAGGPDMMAPPEPVQSYFYLEGNIGYVFQDWTNTFSSISNIGATTDLPINGMEGRGVAGGLTYGGDFGFMFNQYLGLELGWSYLPGFATGDTGAVQVVGGLPMGPLSFRSAAGTWFTVKGVAPVTEHFDAFFKAGVSYRYGKLIFQHVPASNNAVSKMREVRPLLAVGLTYNFARHWMGSVEYMHFVGGTTYSSQGNSLVASVLAPSSNLVMLSIGYKFMV